MEENEKYIEIKEEVKAESKDYYFDVFKKDNFEMESKRKVFQKILNNNSNKRG